MANFVHNRLLFAAVAVLLIAAGFGIWQLVGEDGQTLNNLATSTELTVGTTSKAVQDATSAPSQPEPYEKQFSTKENESGPNQFQSKEYNFTFQYPQDFSVSAFDDRGGHVVLVQAEGGETAVQMFITGWDEPTNAVTPERIKQDLPDLTIRNPEKMSMAGEGDALTFVGESQQFGTTREVWFARSGNLFQIITPASGQEFLSSLLETWKFE